MPLKRIAGYLIGTSLYFCALLVFAEPQVSLPVSGLRAEQLAVIVNENDALSVKIAFYYQSRREIPEQNIIRVRFDPTISVMQPGVFAVLENKIESQLPKGVQAYLLTWSSPYRVGCMSMTSAFTFGFDSSYCATGCKVTRVSPYRSSHSFAPYDDHGIRPAMMLAARNIKEAESLIDRGIAADGSWPAASAYMVETPDKNRSVRKTYFPQVERLFGDTLDVHWEKGRDLKDKKNIMFYFTGDKVVKHIGSNGFLPGAIADHLTSAGGQLTDSFQMSAMRWLEGGVTGSYGNTVEPCNILAKFPNPVKVMGFYLKGATLLEAYWKGVVMPGQGVFIGEPLASPYRGYRLKPVNGGLRLSSPVLSPGQYRVMMADTQEGPYTNVFTNIEVGGDHSIDLPVPHKPFYRVERM